MQKISFNLLFFLKKAKLLKNGEAAICLRITVNKQRVETRIGRSIDPKQWNQAKECSKTRDRSSQELNTFLEELRFKVFTTFQEKQSEDKVITAKSLTEGVFCQDSHKVKTLLSIFDEHNQQCTKLIGIDYVAITVNRYKLCAQYLGDMIQLKYNKDDVGMREIDNEFIRNFEMYLKIEKSCAQNTVIRYMKCLKKIVNLALANDWITKNPFVGIKFQEKEVIKDVLTKEELDIMINKEFSVPRLELVRDIFIFCSFTGLAFIDASQLKPEHITKDNKGKLWIRKPRQKTNNMCNIPLLDIPQKILEKYSEHPISIKKGVCLPILCNQKMNSYLKEVADFCGINKKVSTHTARYTFATTITLANKVTMENVAKMLGHSSTKMTQHYAKVLDSSIMQDMEMVARSFK